MGKALAARAIKPRLELEYKYILFDCAIAARLIGERASIIFGRSGNATWADQQIASCFAHKSSLCARHAVNY
jgi:hypothetical protein